MPWALAACTSADPESPHGARRTTVIAYDSNWNKSMPELVSRLMSTANLRPDEIEPVLFRDGDFPTAAEIAAVVAAKPRVVISASEPIYAALASAAYSGKIIILRHSRNGDDAPTRLSNVVRIYTTPETDLPCLQWLLKLAPGIRSIGILGEEPEREDLQARLAATGHGGVRVHALQPATPEQAAAAIAGSGAQHIDAWYVRHTPLLWGRPALIFEAARQARVPVGYEYSHKYAKWGGLLACATEFDVLQTMADAAAVLLADTELPSFTRLSAPILSISVNLSTAAELGLDLPPAVRRRVDYFFRKEDSQDDVAAPVAYGSQK